MRAVRSLLFVPGHKRDWIDKALNSEADAVIIDLEDAVPEEAKAEARSNAEDAIAAHTGATEIVVRVNALDTDHHGRDVRAVAVAGLSAMLLPKLYGRDDVVRFDALASAAEIENGAPRGGIDLIPSLETANSVTNVEEILRSPRVTGVMGAAAKNADISREVGFRWTAEGSETLYLRSRIVVASRAARIRNIVLGLWQDVRDLEGLRRFAEQNAGLGFTGQVIIHPTHAPIVNDAYSLTADQVDYYGRLVAAFDAGIASGNGAVVFEGEHIDLAHANHAKELLSLTNATQKGPR
jgi:citrate lyase subunit beta/citryl-CoA lyase